MEDLNLFAVAVEEYPWDSQAQKEGYLALIQYQRLFGISPRLPIDSTAAFFIQKDHESHEWWATTVGNQISSLENQISVMQEQIKNLRETTSSLQELLKVQQEILRHVGRATKD